MKNFFFIPQAITTLLFSIALVMMFQTKDIHWCGLALISGALLILLFSLSDNRASSLKSGAIAIWSGLITIFGGWLMFL